MATPSEFSRWLGNMPDRIASTVGRTLPRAAGKLKTQIQANASGRPGPNAPTGDYRGSWQIRPGRGLSVTVFTNRPQARRLEYGFTGTDSLGRNYNQPPYAHVQPAIDAKKKEIEDMIGQAVAAANQSKA